jgi:hypothetical protein
LFPGASYTIVDIPPALDIARWYLTTLFPAAQLRFLSPSDVNEIDAGSCDLAISISSLQEMTPVQTAGYVNLFDRVAEGGAVYLKQKTTWHNPDDGLTFNFRDLPLPRRWRQRYWRRCAVQTSFSEAMWRVG